MKKLILGMIAGITLSFLGTLWAGQDPLDVSLIDSVDRLIENVCTVNVGYGYAMGSNRCSINQVMTGVSEHNGVLCSDITVRCLGKTMPISTH